MNESDSNDVKQTCCFQVTAATICRIAFFCLSLILITGRLNAWQFLLYLSEGLNMQTTHPVRLYSEAINDQLTMGVLIFVSSLSIGSFLGLQLSNYIEIMCATRGTCYGEESGFVYYASLIHPLLIKLCFSAVLLMLFSHFLKTLVPFHMLKAVGLIADKTEKQFRLLTRVTLLFGLCALVFLLPLVYLSTQV
ncbi:MAG TPA: hypothetical protein VFV48_01715 [Pseudomonadales bacterium]|nr:hypothetical protein [Pseudomonadales bacterium]